MASPGDTHLHFLFLTFLIPTDSSDTGLDDNENNDNEDDCVEV